MNSLRVRLIAGFSLVAILPLAVALALLGPRIRATVHEQSDDRLAAALGVLNEQFAADAGRLAEKLARLAADPTLKRHYLVDAPGDPGLRDELANEQFLLDLDYLAVLDSAGTLVADGASSPDARPTPGHDAVNVTALPVCSGAGPVLTALPGGKAVALDGCAPITYRDERVGTVRGGLLLDSLRLAALRRTSGVDLVLRGAGGRTLASTLPAGDSTGATGQGWDGRVVIGGTPYLARREVLAPGVEITALVSTAGAEATLAALRTTSIALACVSVILAVVLGIVWSLQVSRPVERLAEFSRRVSRGEWDQPLRVESVRELQALVEALERMRGDLRTYRERLVAGERQAAYGQMARKVAHEIKNPLTPIAVSVADLKRSYELGRTDFPQILAQAVRTIDEEVLSLKRMLKAFSDYGRFPAPEFAPCRLADVLADLGALCAHDVRAGRLAIEPGEGAVVASVDRGQIRQALLNLVQNGLEATAPAGRVRLLARAAGAHAELVVEDDGPGLTAEQRGRLFVPGFTDKAHGSGLGLTIVEHIVTDHGGTIDVDSAPGRGTTFTLRLPVTRGH